MAEIKSKDCTPTPTIKKEWLLPWNNPGKSIESGEEEEYVKEDTEVNIIDSFKSFSENELQEPLTYTVIDEKHIRHITPKQCECLKRPKPSNIQKEMSSSMESSPFQRFSMLPLSTPAPTWNKPPSKLQLKLGYNKSRVKEWNALRVCHCHQFLRYILLIL